MGRTGTEGEMRERGKEGRIEGGIAPWLLEG